MQPEGVWLPELLLSWSDPCQCQCPLHHHTLADQLAQSFVLFSDSSMLQHIKHVPMSMILELPGNAAERQQDLL